MRRSDREITEFSDITDVLNRADTVRLGINGEDYPYVVPLSFGFEVHDGKITIYFHGAKEGLKHDLIKANPRVCVEAGILHRYTKTERSVTAEYESVIGFGTAEICAADCARRGVDLILEHCGFAGLEYPDEALNATLVYRITLESVTGKRRRV